MTIYFRNKKKSQHFICGHFIVERHMLQCKQSLAKNKTTNRTKDQNHLSTCSVLQCISTAGGHSLVWGRIFKTLWDHQGRKEGCLGVIKHWQSLITEIKKVERRTKHGKTSKITVKHSAAVTTFNDQRHHDRTSKQPSIICSLSRWGRLIGTQWNVLRRSSNSESDAEKTQADTAGTSN